MKDLMTIAGACATSPVKRRKMRLVSKSPTMFNIQNFVLKFQTKTF